MQTGDGYLLGLHRLGWRKGEEAMRVNAGEGSIDKKVIYLHHGLLMNSEVWVCITEKERCLPFQLVEMGYDVWFGNNRGNKYSKKSTRFSPTSHSFWNFSMDEFAFHDIPNSIDYILNTTFQPSLSYIGFSQGTAQAFAALSTHPTLNDKVDVFIALAPAMAPAGLSNGIVDALMKASPEVIFLAFGRRSILSSATMWQSILYPPIFVRVIDMALYSLFNWAGRNISTHQKLAAYPHLYSFTSTKSVVHWFQIIRNGTFQMYDDEVQTLPSLGATDRYYKVAKFPTRNIKTPIVLVYGGSDSLVDINVMLKELPRHTTAKEVPHFEHLDFLWGNDLDTLVFPHVYQALEEFAGRDHTKRLFSPRHLRTGRLISSPVFRFSEDELSSTLGASDAEHEINGSMSRGHTVQQEKSSLSHGLGLRTGSIPSPTSASSTDQGTDGGNEGPPSKAQKMVSTMLRQESRHKRSESVASAKSQDSVGGKRRIGGKGISIGVSKATVGDVANQAAVSKGKR